MYACVCLGITEDQVRQAGASGIVAPMALISVLGLDEAPACGQCAEHVEELVALAREGRARWAATANGGRPAPRGGSVFA